MPHIHVIHLDREDATDRLLLVPVARLAIPDEERIGRGLVDAWRGTTGASDGWALRMGPQAPLPIDALQPLRIEGDRFVGPRPTTQGDLFVTPGAQVWTTVNGVFEEAGDELLAKQGISPAQLQQTLDVLPGMQPPALNSMVGLVSTLAAADFYDPDKRRLDVTGRITEASQFVAVLTGLCEQAGVLPPSPGAWKWLVETSCQAAPALGARNEALPEYDRRKLGELLAAAQERLVQVIDTLAPQVADPALRQALRELFAGELQANTPVHEPAVFESVAAEAACPPEAHGPTETEDDVEFVWY